MDRAMNRAGVVIAAFLLAATALAGTPCGRVTFDTAPYFEGGGYITALAAADFNGDGRVDLLVASGGGSSTYGRSPGLKIFLNDGFGGFANAVTVSNTIYVRDAKTLDFDGDGTPDILVTEEDTGNLIVLANRRMSFSEVWRDYERGSDPVLGDFNGDGRVDIARRVGSELVVLAGGKSTFTKFRFPEPAGVSAGFAAGDLDGDGRADLVEIAPDAYQLFIRRGSASDVLGAPVATGKFQDKPYQVVLGDFDGSGHLDISAQGAYLTLEVLHDPGISLHAPVWQPYAGYDRHIAGDFTGDGVTDLLSHVPFGQVMIGVLGSRPAFETLQPSTFALPDVIGVGPLVAADFDGNGTLDLALANAHDVAVLLNRGGGHFAAPPHIGPAGVRAVVDLNHDGIKDLIADTNPIVWFGNGDGTYRPGSATRPNEGYGTLVEVADVNGDGRDDMVVVAHDPNGTEYGQLWILIGDGAGSFKTTDLGRFGYRPSALVVTDLDRDGKLDIVVGNQFFGPPVTVAYGRGDGTFETAVDVPGSSHAEKMAVGDLDGDGLPDIVGGDGYGRTLFFNLGQRKFRSVSTNESVEKMQLADINGDGKADLIETRNRSYSDIVNEVDVVVRLSRGDGTFAPDIVTKVPINDTDSLDVADLNGDGHPDVVLNDYTSSASTDTFAVLFGTGTGAFDAPELWPSIGRVRIVDVDGDGRPDIMNDDVVRLNICTPARRRSARH